MRPELPTKYDIDGVLFNSGGDSGLYLLELDGWEGAPGKRVNETERVSAHGSYFGPQYYRPRIITAKLFAVSSSDAERGGHLDTLTGLCTSGGTLGRYLFKAMGDSGRSRQAFVMLLDSSQPKRVGIHGTEQLVTLVASDHRVYSVDEQTSDAIGLPTPAVGGIPWNSGLPWNTGIPWQTAPGSSGLLVVVNNGRVPTPVQFDITAASVVSAVGVRHTETNEAVELSPVTPMAPGDVLTIDTAVPEVRVNGNRLDYLAKASFFDLLPGSNTVQFYNGTPGQQATLTARWRDAHLGG
jgi:hypothetical protein